MKKLLTILGIALIFASNGVGQQPLAQTLTLQAPSPSAPSNIGANVVGPSGGTTYYYWVVAKYPIGNSTVFGPATVYNGPNTLSGGNYINVSWSPTTGATGYDLLRTTTNIVPSGTATIQVPTGSTIATSWNDVGAALGSYTVSTVTNAIGVMGLDNLDFSTPSFAFNYPIFAPAFVGNGSGLTGINSLPSMVGNAGKFLTNNGVNASWAFSGLVGQVGNDFAVTITGPLVASVASGRRAFGNTSYTLAACTYTFTAGNGNGTAYLYVTDVGQEILTYPSAGGNTIVAAGDVNCLTNPAVAPAYPTTPNIYAVAALTIAAGNFTTAPQNASLTSGWYVTCGLNLVCTPSNGTVSVDIGANVMTTGGVNTVTGAIDVSTGTRLSPPVGATNPANCNTGDFFFNTTYGVVQTCYAPNLWQTPNPLDHTQLMVVDNFIFGGNTTEQVGELGWTIGNAGAGAQTVSKQNGVAKHPGITRCASGAAAANNGCALAQEYGAATPFARMDTANPWMIGFGVKLNTVANVTFECGIGMLNSAVAGIAYMRFDTVGGDIVYKFVKGDGSVLVPVGTIAPNAANWLWLVMYSNAADGLGFVLVDSAGGSSAALGNYTSAAAGPIGCRIYTRTNASASFDIDKFVLWMGNVF
jgi:hypothetical protein